MHGDAATALAVVIAKSADPGDERIDRHRPIPSRNDGAEVHERMPARAALPVPCPASPDSDLELDHRLEPVDVRSLEQPDLDESHGPRRIASVDRADRRVPIGRAARDGRAAGPPGARGAP